MAELRDSLAGLLQAGWDSLTDPGRPEAGIPGLAVLATMTAAGPEARSVVVRCCDPAAGTVEIHTDSSSGKVQQIRQEPRVGLTHWSSETQLQLRLRGSARLITGADAAATWTGLTAEQRSNYGVAPVPGTVIETPAGYARIANQARFAIICIAVERIDVVHLGAPQHRRAGFQRSDGWKGQWLAP